MFTLDWRSFCNQDTALVFTFLCQCSQVQQDTQHSVVLSSYWIYLIFQLFSAPSWLWNSYDMILKGLQWVLLLLPTGRMQGCKPSPDLLKSGMQRRKTSRSAVPLTLMIKSMDIYLITKHFYAASLKWYEWVVRNEVKMTTDFMHAFIYLDYIYIYTMFTIHDQLSKWQKLSLTLYIVAHFEHGISIKCSPLMWERRKKGDIYTIFFQGCRYKTAETQTTMPLTARGVKVSIHIHVLIHLPIIWGDFEFARQMQHDQHFPTSFG